ncbi:sensor histidine kinase [Larkinella bovis]|uniref:Sensor histidine kinase n=1 Tax=Larkinella bovis TaxID=683041 RepID=A0ABW0I8W0_9BACT
MIMKEWFRFTRIDWFSMLVCYPALFFGNYLVLGLPYFREPGIFLPVTLIETGLYILAGFIMVSWMKYMSHHYGQLNQMVRRVAYCLLFYIVITAGFVCSLYGVFGWLAIPGYRFDPTVFRWTLLLGFMTNIISVGILESAYTYQRWKESVQREYELKKLHMERQLDSLKQQVNPHFLFNSLNSLTALISENPEKAEVFAEELSSVYRYVLRANEQNLTELDTELAFIQSYYHLLKTRYGAGLALDVKIDSTYARYQLPPLTLQLLLENAVKHNVALVDQPLKITIKTNQTACILVSNNLQKKQSRVLSNGIGLTNILAKYQMLGQSAPTIEEVSGQFIVRLPLLKPGP